MLKRIPTLIFALLSLSCSGKPQLTIDPAVYEAGDMAPNERRIKWIKLVNPGETALTIENVRSLCDCITVDSIPETVPPGRADSILITYVAPRSAGPDVNSLVIRTNAEPKNTKIVVHSNVLDIELTAADSTVAVMPFQTPGMADGKKFSLGIFEYLIKNLPEGYRPVNPNEITGRIQADPNYNIEPLHDVARKWARLLGIRYVVLGDIRPSGTGIGVDISVMLIDGFFHLPIGKRLMAVGKEEVGLQVSDTLTYIFNNIRELEKQTLMADLQRKWAEQRAKLMNKPAPPLVAEDIRTGKTLSLEGFRGRPLVVQFFSTDCDHCEEEMDWLSGLVTEHPEIAALGVSVNVGEIDSVVEYIKDKNLLYPVILPKEENEEQLDAYYGGATPQTVIISPDGIVVQSLMGFSRSALRSFERILLEMARADSTSKESGND